MPKVNVTVNGRSYQVGCADGQEDRVRDLAADLNGRACRLAEATGALSEGLVLVLTGLMMADEVADERAARASAEAAVATQGTTTAALEADFALAQVEAGRMQAELAATKAELAATKDALATAQADLGKKDSSLASVQAELDEAHDALRAAHERLAQRRDDAADRQLLEGAVAEAIEKLAIRIETVAERLQTP